MQRTPASQHILCAANVSVTDIAIAIEVIFSNCNLCYDSHRAIAGILTRYCALVFCMQAGCPVPYLLATGISVQYYCKFLE